MCEAGHHFEGAHFVELTSVFCDKRNTIEINAIIVCMCDTVMCLLQLAADPEGAQGVRSSPLSPAQF